MKRRTARVLRAVVRLIEDDVREWGEAVVEIDEREAANAARVQERLDAIEDDLREHLETYDRFAHPPHPVPADGFSVKA